MEFAYSVLLEVVSPIVEVQEFSILLQSPKTQIYYTHRYALGKP